MSASAALTRIGIIKEATAGTTPATPSLVSQRFASANFSLTKPELEDNSKADTRQKLFTKTGNKTVGGNIDGPLAHDNYDTLFESAMFNEFVTDELTMGETTIPLTIEEAQGDIGQYKINRGCIVNGFTINAPVDGLATASFDILGLSQEMAATSVDADDSYDSQPFREPFTHCGGTISEGGTAIGIVTDINFNMTNNISTVFTWGECDPHDLIPARIDVTGTLTVLFSDAALYNKFIGDTASSLSFTMDDGNSNTVQFEMPNIKYTGSDMPVDAGSGLRTISMPFRALQDSVSGSTIIITRSA